MPRAANAAGGGIVSAALNDTNNVTAPLLSFLQRLRDLDEQSAELERGLRDAVDARLDDIRRNPAKRAKPSGPGPGPGPDDSAPSEIETRVRRDGRRCVAIADEKVALAQQAYDLVDQHIARLDKDLRAYDAALAEREAAAAAASGLGGAGAGAGAGAGDRQSLAQMMEAQRMAQVGGAAGVDASYSEGGAPVDPNEPKYCVCNRVSFGEMIACENEGCAVEWFHFACVGLSSDAKIKGKWFCAACTAERRKQKKLLAKEGK